MEDKIIKLKEKFIKTIKIFYYIYIFSMLINIGLLITIIIKNETNIIITIIMILESLIYCSLYHSCNKSLIIYKYNMQLSMINFITHYPLSLEVNNYDKN